MTTTYNVGYLNFIRALDTSTASRTNINVHTEWNNYGGSATLKMSTCTC